MPYNKYISFDLSLHNTLFHFNSLTSSNGVTLKKLHSLLSSNWINEGYSSFDEEMDYKLKAFTSLTSYYLNPLDKGYENILINKFISTTNSNSKFLTCKIDKFYELENGLLELVDYKSGKYLPPNSLMFSNYALYKTLYVVNEKLGSYPDIFSYYYLLYNRKFSINVTDNLKSFLKTYFTR